MPKTRPSRPSSKSGRVLPQPIIHPAGDSVPVAHGVPAAIALAAFRAALAKDAREHGCEEPLDDATLDLMGKMTQSVLHQVTPQRTQLTEALGHILIANGWEEGRVERACDTIWEASQKAKVGRSASVDQIIVPLLSATQKAKEALADFNAREMAEEEQKKESRQQRKLRSKVKRRLRATAKEVQDTAAEDVSDEDAATSDLEEDMVPTPATSSGATGTHRQASSEPEGVAGSETLAEAPLENTGIQRIEPGSVAETSVSDVCGIQRQLSSEPERLAEASLENIAMQRQLSSEPERLAEASLENVAMQRQLSSQPGRSAEAPAGEDAGIQRQRSSKPERVAGASSGESKLPDSSHVTPVVETIRSKGMRWLVKSYDGSGQETEWTIKESPSGDVMDLRIVGRADTSPKIKALQAPSSSGAPAASPSRPDNASFTSLACSSSKVSGRTPFGQEDLAFSFLDEDSGEDRASEGIAGASDGVQPEDACRESFATGSAPAPTDRGTAGSSLEPGGRRASPSFDATDERLPMSFPVLPPRPDADSMQGCKASRAPGRQRPIARTWSGCPSSPFMSGLPLCLGGKTGSPSPFPQGEDVSWNPLTHGTHSDSCSQSQHSSPGLVHNPSPSLFARSFSGESSSSSIPTMPKPGGLWPSTPDPVFTSKPCALWPTTPDVSPWCSFRLPPPEFSLMPTAPPSAADMAQPPSAAVPNAPVPQIVYVPVYIPMMPHRCSHCGHECTGPEPPQAAGGQPCSAGEAPFGSLSAVPLPAGVESFPPGLAAPGQASNS